MEKQALNAKTHLTAVEEAADVGHFHGHVQIRVFHDDHWIAAPKFQSHTFNLTPRDLHDVAADGSRAGEGDTTDARVAQDLFTDGASRTGDDVDRALGQLLLGFTFTKRCLLDQFDGAHGCQWSGARRLDDDRVSGGQSGTKFRSHQGQGEVPRHDAAANADGLANDHAVGALLRQRYVRAADFRGEAGIKFQAVHQVVNFQARFE